MVPALRTLSLMGEKEEEPHTRIHMVQTAVRSTPVKEGKVAECMDIAKEAKEIRRAGDAFLRSLSGTEA